MCKMIGSVQERAEPNHNKRDRSSQWTVETDGGQSLALAQHTGATGQSVRCLPHIRKHLILMCST